MIVAGPVYASPMWSPSDTLIPVEWIVPEPGSEIPFAVVRRVSLRKGGVRVEAFRVVTHSEPRVLIRDGYYPTLSDAAFAAHGHAIAQAGSGALSDQDAYSN